MARQSRGKVKQLKNLLIVDGETEEVYFKNILQRYNMSAKDVKNYDIKKACCVSVKKPLM